MFKLFKGFSLGIEAGYVFGNLENNIVNQIVGDDRATKNQEKIQIRGGSVKFGVLYEKELKNKLMFNFGAAFKLSNEFSTEGSDKLYSLKFTASGEEIPRVVISDELITGNLTNPLESTLGFGLGKANKWFAGLDYEFKKAIKDTRIVFNY